MPSTPRRYLATVRRHGVIHENRKYITYRNAPQEEQAKYRQILFQVLKTQIGFKI